MLVSITVVKRKPTNELSSEDVSRVALQLARSPRLRASKYNALVCQRAVRDRTTADERENICTHPDVRLTALMTELNNQELKGGDERAGTLEHMCRGR